MLILALTFIFVYRIKKFYFVNGFMKVKPDISVFQENLHRSFGFPICFDCLSDCHDIEGKYYKHSVFLSIFKY